MENKQRGGREVPTYGAANDVRNLHEMIVDHVSEVVGRVAITLDENEVILVLVLLVIAVDLVNKGRATLAAEAHYVCLAVCRTPFGLVW